MNVKNNKERVGSGYHWYYVPYVPIPDAYNAVLNPKLLFLHPITKIYNSLAKPHHRTVGMKLTVSHMTLLSSYT